jgi:hypothetical protein
LNFRFIELYRIQKSKMNSTQKQQTEILFNPKWLIAGIMLLISGYLLMLGEGNTDKNLFTDAIFSFRRLTLSPLIVLIGYIIVGISLFKSNSKKTP